MNTGEVITAIYMLCITMTLFLLFNWGKIYSALHKDEDHEK